MNLARSLRLVRLFFAVVLTTILQAELRAQDVAPSPPEVSPEASPSLPPAAFLTRRTVLWTGQAQVIPFRLKSDAPAPSDISLPISAVDSGTIEILRPASVLSGEKLGFVRVRALKIGRTRLQIGGDELDVEVREDRAADRKDDARPSIIGPVTGAAVWGNFAVGVEFTDATPRNELAESTTSPETAPVVQLLLPDNRLLDPIAVTSVEKGPAQRFTFEVAAHELPAGPIRLVAIAKRSAPGNAATRSQTQSDPVTVNVVHPEGAGALSATGACADTVDDARQIAVPLRPVRSSREKPKVGPLPGALSGAVILAHSGEAAWGFNFAAPAAGRYQLFLRARGDEAVGALPSIALYLNDDEQPLAAGRLVHRDWHRLPLGGPFSMPAGPQLLTVQFKNDFTVGKEDRNLYLDRYELLRVPDGGATNPEKPKAPTVDVAPMTLDAHLSIALLYPHNGQNLFGADAVVARFTAPPENPVVWADVILDDQPLGLRIEKPTPGQPLVFPFSLRGLIGPSHHLRVRIADASGNVADSPAEFVNFLPTAPGSPSPYARALRLLDRFGYGAEPGELAVILTAGEQNWLNARLVSPSYDTEAERAMLAGAIAKFPRLDDDGQTIQRALYQAINSENPVRTRFTAFIENHFSTWINKTNAAPKWHEHVAFSKLGIAPFIDLLKGSARSPAMLVYLDQEKSYAKKINENYAREIMELHTLGVHAGYSQSDVTTLAGLLTGWTLTNEVRLPLAGEERMQLNNGKEAGIEPDFRYDPLLNDGKPRRVFGISFPEAAPAQRYDRVQLALEFLAAHPATAEHFCRKIADHYVGTPAPDALVQDLARVYLESGGDARSILQALAAHPLFWSAPDRLATPQDYALRLARRLRSTDQTPDGSKSVKPQEIERFLKLSGMGLFDRVTPDGYPEQDAAYADSNALLQRWRFAQSIGGLINNLVPESWRTPPARTERTTLPEAAFDAPQRLVDLTALRLTGRLLPETSNRAAREMLGENPTPQDAQQTILFISLLPEANLR